MSTSRSARPAWGKEKGPGGRVNVRRLALGALLLVALGAALVIASPLAGAATEVDVSGTITPDHVTEGQPVTVTVTIRNISPTAWASLAVVIQQGTTKLGGQEGIGLAVNETKNFTMVFPAALVSPVNQERNVTVQVTRNGGLVQSGEATLPRLVVDAKPVPPQTFPVVPVVAVAVGGGGGLVALLLIRRKKADQVRLEAESAAKAAVEKRVAEETARELAVTQKVHGKYPAEYFQRRRSRLGVLIATGLTSSGQTVLTRKVAEEKKIIYSCPRCGTHKEAFDAPCPRCSVQDGIEATRGEIKKHRSAGDFTDVGDLLQQAEFQLSYSSFGEASVMVDQARTLFNEILSGAERTVKVKKIETITAGDRKPSVLDLGLGTEHTTTDQVAEEQSYESREEYAREGSHCPTCGHAIYGDLCAYCHFDDYVKVVEDAIARAAKAGAETVEPRDLLERARKMREEDNKSTASRYLNRARFVAKKHEADHLAGKAEGMLDYARTLMLVGEEDGFTADFGAAEATLAEADQRRASGDMVGAVELGAKTEGQIHIALHDLAKKVAIKRLDEVSMEIDDARGKGVTVAGPEAKLKAARAAFDSGDFEKARDDAAAVKKALKDAAKGKALCPKCGKPTQPTWARCPFCTTPLR